MIQLRLFGRWGRRDLRGPDPAPLLPSPLQVGLPARGVVALALVCVPGIAAAQTGDSPSTSEPTDEPFVHESWMVEDGLPVNSVTALLQGRDGYIWLATFDGLVRFDGVRFTVFNSSNTEGLPSNRILDLLEARDGSLWLKMEYSQLVRFRGGVATHIGPERGLALRVTTLREDAQGTLWVGTERGIGIVRDDRFLPVAPEVIRGWVKTIVSRRDGTVWVVLMDGGLFRIEDGRATAFAPESELATEGVTALYEDPEGTLWIGSSGGVWRYRESPERILRSEAVMSLSASPRTGELWVLTASRVYRLSALGTVRELEILRDPDRNQGLLPDGEGQMLYNAGPELHREGRRIYALEPDPAGRRTFEHWIRTMALDHEGSLWIGTNGAGLHRLKSAPFAVYSEAEGLPQRNVTSVYEDRSGTVWIGSHGVTRLADGRLTNVGEEQGFPPTIFSFLQDRMGRLWVGGGNDDGLRVCPAPGRRCTPPAPDPIGRTAVRAIFEEASSALWFGTENGLYRYESGSWARFTEADGAPTFPVRVFQPTRDGALWMGTNGGGLARYHQGRFTHVTAAEGLPFDLVRSLYQDGDGWLWVGTEGRGLARLDPLEWGPGRRGGRIVSYGKQDGLFDEGIHQILEDQFGRLWMSSNRGIFWVERRELNDFAEGRVARIHSTSYTERDGMRNREANGGSQPAGVKTRDGRLWFPTQDGVAVVDPARIQANRVPPNVVIEQVIADGSPLGTDGGALELTANQRDLEIEYTALSFLAPGNMRFRYRLEPYDADWVEAGNRRTAFYTRVPPGHYTFRVLASNNDGVWNEQGAALELSLAPRFWETGTFRALSLAALLLLLVAAFRGRELRARARARELGRLVDERTAQLREHERQLADQNAQLEQQADQLQELDRAKSRFFANVSHEFRTPLTLTIGPLEDLRAELDDGAPRQLDMALRNARRLLRLVNQVLDVAKLEAGQMKLRARKQDLVAFARGIASAFTPVAEQKHIALEVIAPEEGIPVWFDPDALEKVLTNLLSNAFKFTPDGGRIELRVEAEPQAGKAGVARLCVRDTGPGIPPEHLPHLFERFYQVDETNRRAQPGTGIGLALTKELVELHGGSITAGPHPLTPSPNSGRGGTGTGVLPSRRAGEGPGEGGAGATFTVTLPLGRAHLREDQLAAEPEGELVGEDGTLAVRVEIAGEPGAARAAPERGEDVTTLLIADDSADLRAFVRGHFEPRYRVIEAADGAEGLERARERLPDLVISDIMMPHADGNELCRVLKSSPETDFIPVILLTARASTEDRIAGLVGGADDYLAKPFSMRELETRVENLIASRRRLRERFAGQRVELRPAAPQPALAPGDQAFVERLRAAVEAHLSDPGFGVTELAQALFLDRSRVFRRTRELLGETPSELIRRLRLERAGPLLAEGAGSVSEVAYGVGFQSVSHFSQCFREAYGVSPSEYRDSKSVRR